MGGVGSSVKEFVEACKKATGVEIKIDYLPRRAGDYAEVYSDPSKIRKELNWTAKHTNLKESLETAWRWQKLHRNGYGLTTSSVSVYWLCSFLWWWTEILIPDGIEERSVGDDDGLYINITQDILSILWKNDITWRDFWLIFIL